MSYVDTYSDLYDPAFPQSILDLRTELLLGGVWTDISKKVYYRDAVTVVRGHPDESSAANPTAGALTLDNRSGDFSPRNPLGAHYGLLTKNTQLRQSVPEGASYLRSETDTASYASCPDSNALDVTGDLEVQIDVTLTDYHSTALAAKYASAGNQRSWALLFNYDSTLTFVWSSDGTSANAHTAASTLPIPPPVLRRFAVKATLAVATGTVTFYTANTIGGSWTQLGTPVVLGSATSVFASTTPVTVGYNATWASEAPGPSSPTPHVGYTGKVHAFKLLNGIGGTVVANPDFTAQVAGTRAFQDGHANLWTLAGTAEISDRKYRLHGEVPAWPPRWDPTGADVYAPVQPSGLLRRLTQGTPPVFSALYRAYVRATGSSVPLAYWPCEDGTGATQLAAAIGPSAMSVAGTPTLASDTTFDSSQSLPLLSKSTWTGIPPAATTAPTVNTVKFLLAVPTGGATTNSTLISVYTTGTVARIDTVYTTGGNLTITGYNTAGTTLFTLGPFGTGVGLGVDGTPLLAQLSLTPDGAGVDCTYQALTLGGSSSPGSISAVPAVAAGSIGQVTKVIVNPGGVADSVAVGHITVGVADDIASYYNPLNAWAFEPAGARFTRLCAEEGIASRVIGAQGNIVQHSSADTVQMGAQTPQAIVPLLQECESADLGLIFEPRQVLGLGYRTRASMLNQPVAVALDYSLADLSDPVEPTDDDQLTANDITVQRTSGGSSARQVLTTGALSIQPPPNGVGSYGSAPPAVNLASDTQLNNEAGWLLHLGTVNDVRYPTLSVDLARSELAALYYTLQDLDVGDRVTVANTPAWLPPDGISQIVRGANETCYSYIFTEAFVCVPESPYRVGVYDDPVLGRYDTDASALRGGYSSGATTLLVATTNPNSPLWTTAPADFPFDIAAGGERMTVTNITGSSSPQTFTVVRAVNGIVKAQTDGTAVSLFQPAVYSL